MDASNIYRETEQHVTGLFKEHQSPKLLYHNLEHTLYVVNRTKEIAEHYPLSEQETLVLFMSAWFHDLSSTLGS